MLSSFFYHFPLYPSISFYPSFSLFSPPFLFQFPLLRPALAFLAAQNRQTSVNLTLMFGIVEVMKDQFLSGLTVCAPKSKELLDWLRDPDNTPAREIICLLRINWAFQCEAKTFLPNSWKWACSTDATTLCCENWILNKYLKFYTGLLSSKLTIKEAKEPTTWSLVCSVTINAQHNTWTLAGRCSTLCRHSSGD